MKLVNLFENDDEPVQWENTPQGDVEKEIERVRRAYDAAKHAVRIAQQHLKKYQDIIVDDWKSQFPTLITDAKYSGQYVRPDSFNFRMAEFLIPNNTPNIDKLWPAVKHYADRSIEALQIMNKAEARRKVLNKKYKYFLLTRSIVNKQW